MAKISENKQKTVKINEKIRIKKSKKSEKTLNHSKKV